MILANEGIHNFIMIFNGFFITICYNSCGYNLSNSFGLVVKWITFQMYTRGGLKNSRKILCYTLTTILCP